MSYFNFENQKTPINDINLNAMQKGLMELVFPIGSTYVTQSDTNPSTILNFGTWERLKGKVCLGLDEDDDNFKTIGNVGGEKEHTLTIQEMPSHNHNFNKNNIAAMASSGSYDLNQGSGSRTYELIGIEKTGGNQPHNNMQPYEIVGYMWIRRS